MLIIRLSRTGRKNLPDYNIVVTEKSHAAISGRYLEKLGYYNPLGEKPVLEYDKARLEHFLKNGAQVSETMARMLHKDGIPGMERFVDMKKKFQVKSNKAVEEAPAAEVKAEEGGESEEVKSEEGKSEEVKSEEVKSEEGESEEVKSEEGESEEGKSEEGKSEEGESEEGESEEVKSEEGKSEEVKREEGKREEGKSEEGESEEGESED